MGASESHPVATTGSRLVTAEHIQATKWKQEQGEDAWVKARKDVLVAKCLSVDVYGPLVTQGRSTVQLVSSHLRYYADTQYMEERAFQEAEKEVNQRWYAMGNTGVVATYSKDDNDVQMYVSFNMVATSVSSLNQYAERLGIRHLGSVGTIQDSTSSVKDDIE